MKIDFSQLGQELAPQNVNQITQTLAEGNNLAVKQEKLSDQAKVVQLSAEKSEEGKNRPDNVAFEKAVAEISEFIFANNRQLMFSVDEGSEKSVIKVTDAESGDIIRQIPSEEVLRLSERLKDFQSAVGVLFNKQV
jgi:flagellar protein FlaG